MTVSSTFQPMTDRPLLHQFDLARDRQFREASHLQPSYNWSKPFAPPIVKNELFPPPTHWPPSPPGQESHNYFLNGQHQHQGAIGSAGFLTPSPCSSDSSEKPSTTAYETYVRPFSPFYPFSAHQSQPAPHIWNPYSNLQYPISYPLNDSSSAPTYLSNEPTLMSPAVTASTSSPVSTTRQQENSFLSNYALEQELELCEDRKAATTSEHAATHKRKKRCRCTNCITSGSAADGTGKKRHVCDVDGCGKLYGKTSHLKAHLRWHLGLRPFCCSYSTCGKTFTR